MRNRPNARSGGSGGLHLDPLVLRHVQSDGASLCVIEPIVDSDVCEHIDIRNVLCTEEVGLSDRYRETMLCAALCCGLNERMSCLGRIGVKLVPEVQIQPGGPSSGLGSGEGGTGVGDAVTRAKQIGNEQVQRTAYPAKAAPDDGECPPSARGSVLQEPCRAGAGRQGTRGR